MIRKTYDEEGNIIYFKSKTVQCAQPENTREEGWDVSSPEKEKEFVIKKSWIADNEGASFVCSNGYLTSGTSGNYSCVSYDQICPLNENIQKSGTSYINPYTGDTCSVPSLAEITNVGTNLYTFDCPDNYYTDSSNYVQCNKCPDGTYSIKGSNKNAASCIVGTAPTATTITDEEFNLILENNPYLLSTVNPEGCPDGTFAEEISETNYLELLKRYAEMPQSYVVSVTPTTRTSSDETTNTETTN